MEYAENLESLRKHECPEWFKRAKLGIFIHWGLYSVPAFAPTKYGLLNEMIAKYGAIFTQAHSPYAEWYQNSWRIFKGEYKEFHTKEYGAYFQYEDFAPMFNESIKKWDPDGWSAFFKKIGARYVVLTSKHHEGFTLWPSKHPNPKRPNYYATRDIVGELTQAVRKEGLKMGLYYSGLYDWSFSLNPVEEALTYISNGPPTEEYGRYCDNHLIELIDTYKPDVIWNDLGYPLKGNKFKVISHYYNSVPDGVVNDRWKNYTRIGYYLKYIPFLKKIIDHVAKKRYTKMSENYKTEQGGPAPKPSEFADFSTTEYKLHHKLSSWKWEANRGLGRSFGYNRMEKEEHHLTHKELIINFIDVVSKNGNLLINIGPTAEGGIPEIQKNLLETLGEWVSRNKEGIFDTVPWKVAEGKTDVGIDIRYTTKGEDLFIFLLDVPEKSPLKIYDLKIPLGKKITLMDTEEEIKWKQEENDLVLNLPQISEDFIVPGLKII